MPQPTTPRGALLAYADHLDAAPPDATWLPPASIAKLIREHAELYPAAPEPTDLIRENDDLRTALVGLCLATERHTLRDVDSDIGRALTRAQATLGLSPVDGPPLHDDETRDLGDGMTASWSEEYGCTTLRLETDLDDLPITRPQMDELRRFADRHWPAPATTAQLTIDAGVAR